MNTTQTQALAPSSTHPGAATAAATPTHFPLTTEAHVRLARGSIWKRWRCICCGSDARRTTIEISKRDIPIAA